MTINYTLTEGLELQRNGAMIDLVASKNYVIGPNCSKLIELGISMQLPKFIMAVVPPRSGLYSSTSCIIVNSVGIIDPPIENRTNINCPNPEKLNGYIGNGDKWKANLFNLSSDSVKITKGNRLCQFHLTPTMDCPWYIWLKWIFKRKIIFNRVDILPSNKNRGGFNSTGLK
jgi:dUTPase